MSGQPGRWNVLNAALAGAIVGVPISFWLHPEYQSVLQHAFLAAGIGLWVAAIAAARNWWVSRAS